MKKTKKNAPSRPAPVKARTQPETGETATLTESSPVSQPSTQKGAARVSSFSFQKEWLPLLALAVFAVLAWCALNNRFSAETWQIPLEYGMKGYDGDALGVLAAIKASEEGEFTPGSIKKLTRLGAPYYGNWSDYPVIEDFRFYFAGVLGRVIGIFAATNFAVLLAQVLACLAFYVVARALGSDRVWAFVGGVIFGFARFAFAREIHHLVITCYWHVPLCLLFIWWLTRGEMGPYRGKSKQSGTCQ